MPPSPGISVYNGKRELHFTMRGRFDRSFAENLIHGLRRYYKGQPKVFFHTSGLQQVLSSGVKVFQAHLSALPIDIAHVDFTGENAFRIAPNWRSVT